MKIIKRGLYVVALRATVIQSANALAVEMRASRLGILFRNNFGLPFLED
jgi:hypothetical protein